MQTQTDYLQARLMLVRHTESLANAGVVMTHQVGDYKIGLTPRGMEQAIKVGRTLGGSTLKESLIYVSPYLRTRQTLHGMIEGARISKGSLKVYEDPRLREVEIGYNAWDTQQDLRKKQGWFWYRYQGGESPADCFDRLSTFLESMTRQTSRSRNKQVVVVTHGMTIRCFVMRFLHLTPEEVETIQNPDNGAVVVIEKQRPGEMYQFTRGKWGVTGLRLFQ